jgi:hypothetical protein
MPDRDRAAYMRDYRARRGADERGTDGQAIRIAELEAEVARLKRLLAGRPEPQRLHPHPLLAAMGLDENTEPIGRFNSRPFTPVPKKG